MKTLPQKVSAVKKLFTELDADITKFSNASGLHCLAGCGACCTKPDVEATILEFLPLALDLFDQGKSETVLEELNQKNDDICHVFRPFVTHFGGMCNAYPHRGLICRLFGFSARRNKEGDPELVTCRIIKENQAAEYEKTIESIKSGADVPVMSNYYSRLVSIDHSLSDFYPINTAMKKAIEYVMHYYAYRKRRRNG